MDVEGVWFAGADGYGIVQHSADDSLVTPANPARRGEVLVGYATGLGSVSVPVETGHAVDPGRVAVAQTPRDVLISGTKAEVYFEGLAPALVGVFQINFRVPDNTAPGDAELTLSNSFTSCPPFGACEHRQRPVTNTVSSRSVKLAIR